MLDYIASIWRDLKSGRNIDIYITLGLALFISVLDVFGVVEIEIVLTAILATLALLANNMLNDRHSSQPPIVICKDDKKNTSRISKYIESHEIKHAKLIQYSGQKVTEIVELLLSRGVKVEMLLHYPGELLREPKKTPNGYQLSKSSQFQVAVRDYFRNRENLTIRYYKEPASIRGIKCDDKFLSIGWYTYRNQSIESTKPWLYGHNNATIHVTLTYAEAQDLNDTFEEVFQTLWNSSLDHSDVEDVINQIEPVYPESKQRH